MKRGRFAGVRERKLIIRPYREDAWASAVDGPKVGLLRVGYHIEGRTRVWKPLPSHFISYRGSESCSSLLMSFLGGDEFSTTGYIFLPAFFALPTRWKLSQEMWCLLKHQLLESCDSVKILLSFTFWGSFYPCWLEGAMSRNDFWSLCLSMLQEYQLFFRKAMQWAK